MKTTLTRVYALLLTLICISAEARDHQTETITFTARSGDSVEAEQGYFNSPVRHEKPDGDQLRLSYVRFPSTNPNPGNPIVYLAGGPGGPGTGTARGGRFPLFMALREVADVIAFDQRGTGDSNQTTRCKRDKTFSLDHVLSMENIARYDAKVVQSCLDWWRAEGHDVDAYNTWQSAGDLDVLRQVLGAEKINLWGISYGSHLALATIKRSPESIDSVVLTALEGLDHTVKLPAHADAYFERVQQVIDLDPEAKKAYPDIIGLMKRVHDRYREEPLSVQITNPADGQPTTIRIDTSMIQAITAFAFVKNPSNVTQLPGFYTALDHGETSMLNYVIPGILQQINSDKRLMSTAMDVSSGISQARLEKVKQQAPDSVLGSVMNYPMPHLLGKLDIQDLGDEFRTDPKFDGPTLFLTGTLDGRTFPEASRQILEGFSKGQLIMVHNAGHDLFMSDPKITETIVAFLGKQSLPYESITIAPPRFVTGQ